MLMTLKLSMVGYIIALQEINIASLFDDHFEIHKNTNVWIGCGINQKFYSIHFSYLFQEVVSFEVLSFPIGGNEGYFLC